MAAKTIDAGQLRQIILAGGRYLDLNKEWINDLNVFPVPDGDTGTNMTLTIMSASHEMEALTDLSMESLSKAISSGSLRGARGNSGVILSQLLRGFTKEIRTVSTIDTVVLARAFQRASETAYRAVMKPKEGTILTVARAVADKAAEIAGDVDDLETFMNTVIEEGDRVLGQTPELLPVLKEAGVIDSGGQGLMILLKGCLNGALGIEPDMAAVKQSAKEARERGEQAAAVKESKKEYEYSAEYTICLPEESDTGAVQGLKSYLESIGGSVSVIPDDQSVRVCVMTNDPGLAIQKGISFGSLTHIKIDNMLRQFSETYRTSEPAAPDTAVVEDTVSVQTDSQAGSERKEVGFVAVSLGDGMSEIFTGLGVDVLIEGGQTMNPSTEDILNAIDEVNADVVYVLPNNKNVILAAEQAVKMSKDKQVVVVPSRTIPQGITALISYMPGRSPEGNLQQMVSEMNHVRTGEVTYAVRNTSVGGVEVHEGDIMGIDDNSILAVGREVAETSFRLLQALVSEESELISLYYGADVTEEEANKFLSRVEKEYPDRDVEMHRGGQPIYYYVMSAE